jgi:hypothetical protein
MFDWVKTNLVAVISVVGWLVTALSWMVAQRGQRRLFVHRIKNAARLEIVAAIRERQANVRAISASLLRLTQEHRLGGFAWAEWISHVRPLIGRTPDSDLQWIHLLEQYEVLFPKSADCRRQLVDRHLSLVEDLSRWWLIVLSDGRGIECVHQAKELVGRLDTETALLDDLLVYLQNSTLGDVVGLHLEFRSPKDSQAPRIVVAKDGRPSLWDPNV